MCFPLPFSSLLSFTFRSVPFRSVLGRRRRQCVRRGLDVGVCLFFFVTTLRATECAYARTRRGDDEHAGRSWRKQTRVTNQHSFIHDSDGIERVYGDVCDDDDDDDDDDAAWGSRRVRSRSAWRGERRRGATRGGRAAKEKDERRRTRRRRWRRKGGDAGRGGED